MDPETQAKIDALHDILIPQDDFQPSNRCGDPNTCRIGGVCQRAAIIFQELRQQASGLDSILAETMEANPSCGSDQYEAVIKAVGEIYPGTPTSSP